MMNCKEIENNIWEYIEQSLDTDRTKIFSEHIKNCNHCASIEHGLRASMQLINQSKVIEADPYFFTRLEARMEQQAQTNTPKISYSIRYAMAASIAFIGIIGGSFFGSYSAEQLNSGFVENSILEQNDELGIDIADNSFDLFNDFE